jgi:hypothetical protein
MTRTSLERVSTVEDEVAGAEVGRRQRGFEARAAFSPWDTRELPGAFDVEETARMVGSYAWIEVRLFEALGGWVATVPELDVKILFGRHCYHHACHSQAFSKRLPELREINPERATQPANEGLAAFAAALAEPGAPELTIEKMVGVYRVLLPRMVATYSAHAALTSPITDAPTVRILDQVLRDDFADWAEGEAVLQTLLSDGAALERARVRQVELEAMLVAAGGLTGTGPLTADLGCLPSMGFRPVGT